MRIVRIFQIVTCERLVSISVYTSLDVVEKERESKSRI